MSKKTFLSCLLVLSSLYAHNSCEGCSTNVTTTSNTVPLYSTAKPLGANVTTQETVKVTSDRALIYIRNEDSQPMTVVFAPQKITNDPSIKDMRKAGDMFVTVPANSFVGIWVKKRELGDSINLFQVEVYDDKVKAENPQTYSPEWVGDNLVYGKIYLLTYKQQNPFTSTCNLESLNEPIKDFPNQIAQGVEVRKDLPASGN